MVRHRTVVAFRGERIPRTPLGNKIAIVGAEDQFLLGRAAIGLAAENRVINLVGASIRLG